MTVELRVFDHDPKPHVVTLVAPGHRDAARQPRGHATEDVTGLRKGTYQLLVDGRPGARLVIGAVAGP